jgi:hypothetical protein
MMRRWFAILGMLVLAACQQAPASGTAPAQSAVGSQANHGELAPDWKATGEAPESKYFAAEFKATRNQMVAEMFGGCYQHLRDKDALDRCLRKELIATFDDSREGQKHCQESEIDAYTDCIILGNVAVDIARRLDANVKVDPAIWSGRRAFADFLGKVAVMGAISACGDAKTESSATSCMFDWLIAKLSLPETLSNKCSPDLAAEERGACFGQAATIRFVQERLSRLPAANT